MTLAGTLIEKAVIIGIAHGFQKPWREVGQDKLAQQREQLRAAVEAHIHSADVVLEEANREANTIGREIAESAGVPWASIEMPLDIREGVYRISRYVETPIDEPRDEWQVTRARLLREGFLMGSLTTYAFFYRLPIVIVGAQHLKNIADALERLGKLAPEQIMLSTGQLKPTI